jgi:hypothetical protein
MMAGRPAAFTEADLKRAIRAAQAAGLQIGAVEIDRDGRIRLVAGSQTDKPVDVPKEWHF